MLTTLQKAGDLMTHMTTFEAAQKLYKKYGTRSPFEIIDVVPDMKLWMSEAYPADGLRGFATIQNRIRYAVVNSFLQPEEQRIVAAHELGHLIRHEVRLRIQPMQDFDVYAATGKLEREANFFAAEAAVMRRPAPTPYQNTGGAGKSGRIAGIHCTIAYEPFSDTKKAYRKDIRKGYLRF